MSVWETLPGETAMVAVVVDVTADALTVKAAPVKPAPIEIDGGTVRLGLEELSARVRPPAGAGFTRLNRQEDVPGVCTVIGVHARLEEPEEGA